MSYAVRLVRGSGAVTDVWCVCGSVNPPGLASVQKMSCASSPSPNFWWPLLYSVSTVNKPSSQPRQMPLPDRRAASGFYLPESFYISAVTEGRRTWAEASVVALPAGVKWSEAFEAAAHTSTHLFPRPKRRARAQLSRSSKRKIIWKKRPVCWAGSFPVSNPPFNRPACDASAFNVHFITSFRPLRCKYPREENQTGAELWSSG